MKIDMDKLATASNAARRENAGLSDDSEKLDRIIVEAVLNEYARLHGFANLLHLERHLTPVPLTTLSFAQRHNLGRRIDDEDKQRGGL